MIHSRMSAMKSSKQNKRRDLLWPRVKYNDSVERTNFALRIEGPMGSCAGAGRGGTCTNMH